MRLFAGTKFDRPPRCEVCGELEEDCTCPPPEPVRIPPQKQTARLALEKRKRGKLMTVIRGLDPEGNDLPALLTLLKNRCGAGGTLSETGLEIQGDQLQRVRSELQTIGYEVQGG